MSLNDLPPDCRYLDQFNFSGQPARELAELKRRWLAMAKNHPQTEWGMPGERSSNYWALVKDFFEFAKRNGCIEESPYVRPATQAEIDSDLKKYGREAGVSSCL